MKIENLKLENYKGHKATEMSFDPNLTVILGENGSGKSSILDSISICLSWIIARIKNQKGQGGFIPLDDIFNGQKNGVISARFTKINQFAVTNKTKSGLIRSQSSFFEDLNYYVSETRAEIERTSFNCSIPVFAHYGVRRAVIDIPLRVRGKQEYNPLETYNDSLKGNASFKTFFKWFRNQEDIENEKIKNRYMQLSDGQSIEDFNDPDDTSFRLDRELFTVRNALSVFMPNYKNLRITRHPLRMIVDKDGSSFKIDQLSDGEKTYIALIGDLCKKLVLANPNIENPLHGEGIVLIDELDLHLHPNWQKDIASRLTTVFPNIQFIVTTHSPIVVTNVKSECLRILDNIDGNISVIMSNVGYALPIAIIMKELMQLKNELPKEVEDLINKTYDLLKNGSIDEIKAVSDELKIKSPHLPELSRIEKLIERKERIDAG